MTTFTGWLHDQENRDNDPVGWFARFWRDLEGKPRLSAVASITKHLEDRDLFRLTPGLAEAHDATLAEYRKMREGIVRTVTQEALPGLEQPAAAPERGLAGQAVDRASAAGLAAAQAHTVPPGTITFSSSMPQLDRIEHKLGQIMAALGLAGEDSRIPGTVLLPPPAITGQDWATWFEQADLAAEAE